MMTERRTRCRADAGWVLRRDTLLLLPRRIRFRQERCRQLFDEPRAVLTLRPRSLFQFLSHALRQGDVDASGGVSYVQLGIRYGLSNVCVGRAIRRETWKHA